MCRRCTLSFSYFGHAERSLFSPLHDLFFAVSSLIYFERNVGLGTKSLSELSRNYANPLVL